MSKGARKHENRDETARQVTIPAPTGDASSDDAADAAPPSCSSSSSSSSNDELIIVDRDLPLVLPNKFPPERPTTVPDYDVEALAAASFHGAKQKVHLPLDLSVPVRVPRASVCGAPLRAAFLLSHVDDRMTITEIASCAQIPIADAIENFVLLSDLGVVELRGAGGSDGSSSSHANTGAAEQARPKSGLRAKS